MSYPWIKDGQYVTPAATNYLAVTSPNGLYLTDGVSPATIITPTSVTSTTFNGNLNGTVTNATNATNATNVAITEDGTTNAAFYPVFVSTNSGNLALKVDKTTTPLSYNPSTGEFLSQSFAATITNGTVFSRMSSTQIRVANIPSNIVTIDNNQITVFTSGVGTTTITPASVTSASFIGNASTATTATTATNIAGGAAGRIPYQTGAGATSFVAVGNGGQFLQANGPSAPTWVDQNKAATPSGITTSIPSSGSDTLAVNFNNSFSSVTNYTVNFTSQAGTIIRTINNYSLSGGVAGGQYTLVIQFVTITSNSGTNVIFNGTGLTTTPIPKTNFTTISTGNFSGAATKYVVLTFAYDGTNYFLSGSNFT